MSARKDSSPLNNNCVSARGILSGVFDNFNRPVIGYWRMGMPPPSSWPKVSGKYYLLTVDRMKKRGWLEEVKKAKKGGKRFLKLTKKGRVQALLYKLQEIKQPVAKSWDGKWRLAIFDIPEQAKSERNRIRRVLKCVGFQVLQKSVYIYPFELPAHTVAYLEESGLSKFIRFIRADKMDNDKDLKRRFEL